MRITNLEELDKSLCPFYDKTGCCNKEDLCNKTHRNAEINRCLIFHQMYPDPDLFINSLDDPSVVQLTDDDKQNLFNAFYIDIVSMLKQFGPLDDVVVASNKNDTLNGNVFAMFREVDAASAAYLALNGQFYAGRKIRITFSPIIRLSSAVCRVNEDEACTQGNSCNFIHPYNPSNGIMDDCFPRINRKFARAFRKSNKTSIRTTPIEALYGERREKNPTGPKIQGRY
ncbi:hypothetical protein TRFO_03851 [Tritrichomonas foetus]|uniref:Uncharacterized protein n=1 Tax=Tritrichomonas foetus TaxID=1144522 RepID=A0A1J4KK16_9EUKA|nr:hypothetical protein TRFO_03851 [Tritrichomonas foetus]|eukprot:OHT11647.1 hypothetical protein TRFO_03851 [Tritrichomonas foetus]